MTVDGQERLGVRVDAAGALIVYAGANEPTQAEPFIVVRDAIEFQGAHFFAFAAVRDDADPVFAVLGFAVA